MRRKILIGMSAVVCAVLLTAVTVYAKDKKDSWTKVGTAKAGGDAKEFAISKKATTCRITCTEGEVIINTVVAREGGKATPIKVAHKFKAKESLDVDLDGSRNLTGLRISDDRSGSYEVMVK